MVAKQNDDDDIILIDEIFHQPPEKKLLRIMSRVLTEDNEMKYVVAWLRHNELFCTLESITNVLDHKMELKYLQNRCDVIDIMKGNLDISREKMFQLNESLPGKKFFSNLEKDNNTKSFDYWRIKRLEILWLYLTTKHEINSMRKVKTAPLYIEGWHRNMYSRIPNFKYIINGYVWSAQALTALKFYKKRKRSAKHCYCCACEKGCLRCENPKGTFLKIVDNLAVFPESEDDNGEYYWTYECSHYCRCKTTCQYKLLKKGRKIALIVTWNCRKGWILRAADAIKKGQFITEFVGEIICADEASERSTNYQMVMERGFYLDCEPYGNESRFISHSCEPNAAVVRIFGIKDSFVYGMAVVANKNISQGSEITIDYHPGVDSETISKNGSRCFCAARKCRKWL